MYFTPPTQHHNVFCLLFNATPQISFLIDLIYSRDKIRCFPHRLNRLKLIYKEQSAARIEHGPRDVISMRTNGNTSFSNRRKTLLLENLNTEAPISRDLNSGDFCHQDQHPPPRNLISHTPPTSRCQPARPLPPRKKYTHLSSLTQRVFFGESEMKKCIKKL